MFLKNLWLESNNKKWDNRQLYIISLPGVSANKGMTIMQQKSDVGWYSIRVSQPGPYDHSKPDNPWLQGEYTAHCRIYSLIHRLKIQMTVFSASLKLWKPKMVPEIAKCPLRTWEKHTSFLLRTTVVN